MAALLWPALTHIAQAQNIDLNAAPSTQIEPRLQKGKRPALLKTAKDFALEPVTTGLGNISALAYDGQTYLYASDRESGRVWRLSDRNRDGRYESKQALPHRFDNPSGIAIKNDHLYVADKNAVWSVKRSLPPSILAGLRQSDSKGEFHPLALSADAQTLFLGLTTQSHETKILSIDTKTGVSDLMETGRTRSSIVSLSMAPNDAPWIITENSLGMRPSQLTQFDENQNLAGLALFSSNSDWSEALPNHVILSRQSSHGFDIVATPTNFGQATSKAEVLLNGFLSSSGRTAWGAPSALVFDTKGLILSDSFNGDLYRLRYAKTLKEITNPESSMAEEPQTSEKPASDLPPSSLLSKVTGSQIESASSLDAGSNIAVGSTIVRDYEPLSTNKEENEND
jgi:glucose/arabinose dehydrogenase